jgi:hypothetical protein
MKTSWRSGAPTVCRIEESVGTGFRTGAAIATCPWNLRPVAGRLLQSSDLGLGAFAVWRTAKIGLMLKALRFGIGLFFRKVGRPACCVSEPGFRITPRPVKQNRKFVNKRVKRK